MKMVGQDWIRTNDLCRVKASIISTFNNLQDAGDCQSTWKYARDEIQAGDFTGERLGKCRFLDR